MGKVMRPFCWHQNFVPWGLSASAPGLYTWIKSWKKLYKIRLQRHFLEACNKWMKWQDISVDTKTLSPGGCRPLTCPGAIYMYKIEKKNCIQSDEKRFFWNLQQMTKVTRCSCWHKNVPKGLSAPALGLYTCIKSWKKLYKIRLQRDFLKPVANDQSDERFLLTSKFFPWGCLPLTSGCIHLLNHEKMCIKSGVEEILFKLATNDHSD